ncbi:MAG: hypothetical protein FD180_1690 [Planctomycetota bacterium]|nr:MAG: hypothetical protein FD180_1690 [Planctomycetota bacterium]
MHQHLAAPSRDSRGPMWKWVGVLTSVNALSLLATWAEVSLVWPKILGYPLMLVNCAAVALLLAAILSILGVLPMMACSLFSPGARKLLGPFLALAATLTFTSFLAQLGCRFIWDRGFSELARNSSPLVSAIRKFETDRGRPPADLEALVAEGYIAAVPATPCGCSDYRYNVKSRGNPWTLTVTPPFRGIGSDRFDYWPHQDYPERDLGGRYERIGDWAYYHE